MQMVKESVTSMWKNFLSTLNDSASKNLTYTSWPFGANAEQARELADLVKTVEKTGTSSLYLHYEHDKEPVPQIGEYSIITDWDGEAEAIIQNVDVNIMPFHEVGATFARKEGEGDKSLAYWRRVHIDFFTNELKELNKTFSEDMYL